MRGTVIAVDPTEKDLVVRTDAGAQRRLDASYVAEHLQHAYALTAHTIQGATVEWAGVVGRPEDFTRNWSYTALSRAREPTELFILDTPTERELDRIEIAPNQTRWLGDERTPIERLETAMRCRDDEDLALDRVDGERTRVPAQIEPAHAGASVGRPSVVELQAELAQLREGIGHYPEHLVDQLHAARSAQAEAQRVADAARARIAELAQPARGVLRRGAADSAERALQRQRLKLAEEEIAAAGERERNLADEVPDRGPWEAERRVLRERAAELNAQLSTRRREHLRVVLKRPAPHLTEALDALPDQPRARRTWQQAATRIEAYRFDHAISDPRNALGLPPTDRQGRAHWQRAHHDLQRAQRDLGHHNARRHSHEV
jgi:chromosome segregation ATPase